jgi:transposase-like protein
MRQKLNLNESLSGGTPIDTSGFYERIKRQEEETNKRIKEESEAEERRIAEIKCPVCKSTEKTPINKYKSNGVFGPGSRSWLVENYIICNNCGVHYSDLTKIISK